MIDIALTLDKLLPQTKYGGAFEFNTKEEYDALRWEDSRLKPSWKEIEDTWIIVQSELKKQTFKDKAKQMLSESDWSETISAQMDLANGESWINYRRELRKLLVHPTENPVFPTKPEIEWKI